MNIGRQFSQCTTEQNATYYEERGERYLTFALLVPMWHLKILHCRVLIAPSSSFAFHFGCLKCMCVLLLELHSCRIFYIPSIWIHSWNSLLSTYKCSIHKSCIFPTFLVHFLWQHFRLWRVWWRGPELAWHQAKQLSKFLFGVVTLHGDTWILTKYMSQSNLLFFWTTSSLKHVEIRWKTPCVLAFHPQSHDPSNGTIAHKKRCQHRPFL